MNDKNPAPRKKRRESEAESDTDHERGTWPDPTEGSASDLPDSGVMRTAMPTGGIDARRMRTQLLDIGIIDAADWDQSAESTLNSSEALPILLDLQHRPRRRPIRGAERLPALTHFQFQEITAGNASKLLFDDFVLLDRIGSGGMANVFLAFDRKDRALTAIKTVREVALRNNPEAIEQFRRRLHREKELLASLNHPGLPRIKQADYKNGVAYFAMDYVPGRTFDRVLRDLVEQKKPLEVDWIVRVAREAAGILGYIHKQGVIHRDIKPSNFMVRNDGRVILLDLGFARLHWLRPDKDKFASLTSKGTNVGTPEYMAPEQWMDAKQVGAPADLYSLGCTLFFLLTGRPPYAGKTPYDLLEAHVRAEIPKVEDHQPGIPKALSACIRKLLAKKPEDRFQTAAELIVALDRVEKGDRGGPGRRFLRSPMGLFALTIGVCTIALIGLRLLSVL